MLALLAKVAYCIRDGRSVFLRRRAGKLTDTRVCKSRDGFDRGDKALGVLGVFVAEPVSNVIGGTASYVTMRMTVYRKMKNEIGK